jgi:DNA-directed RNA polymerase specialized sigma24 family protein
MTSPPSVTTWLGRLQAGDPDGAEALWRRYFARLVELASQHLARHVRRAADAQDVALSAFASFCAGAAGARFPQLLDRRDLWRLLLTLTLRHARNLARHETRQVRDGGRTVAATDLLGLPEADLDRLAGDAPDSALAAEVADQLRHLLELLPAGELRCVAQDLLAGYTAVEIAPAGVQPAHRGAPLAAHPPALGSRCRGRGGRQVKKVGGFGARLLMVGVRRICCLRQVVPCPRLEPHRRRSL